jgi:hypothetical protein
MDSLEYDHNVFNTAQRDADKTLAVRFYNVPVRNEHRSAEEGRPIFEDTEHVEIRVRGDRNNIVMRPTRPEDRIRFADAYRAHEKGLEAKVNGTPLAEWPAASASFVEEMKFLGFFTVEQLAEATDSVVQKIPGMQTFKNKAKAFLEFAKGAAPLEKLQAELDEQKSRTEVAERTAHEMSARMAELEQKYTAILEAQASGKQAKLPIPVKA